MIAISENGKRWKSWAAIITGAVIIIAYTIVDIRMMRQLQQLEQDYEELKTQQSLAEENLLDLTEEVEDLRLLEKPNLHPINFHWSDSDPYRDPFNLSGIIFNAGNQTATQVMMIVNVYDGYNDSRSTHEIPLEDIGGRTYITFDFDIKPYCVPRRVSTYLMWKNRSTSPFDVEKRDL